MPVPNSRQHQRKPENADIQCEGPPIARLVILLEELRAINGSDIRAHDNPTPRCQFWLISHYFTSPPCDLVDLHRHS